jgi:hypothetical protein
MKYRKIFEGDVVMGPWNDRRDPHREIDVSRVGSSEIPYTEFGWKPDHSRPDHKVKTGYGPEAAHELEIHYQKHKNKTTWTHVYPLNQVESEEPYKIKGRIHPNDVVSHYRIRTQREFKKLDDLAPVIRDHLFPKSKVVPMKKKDD